MKPRRSQLALLGLLLCWGIGATRPSGIGEVREIRIFDHDTHTRVVIELSRETEYTVHELSSPPRLYVDIDETWIDAPQREPLSATKKRSPVRLVRGGQNTLHRARIVMELDDRDKGHRIFHLQNPFRIVADVYTGEADATPRPVDHNAFDRRPVQRVLIDPGHGGKDPGAIGRGKLREKDVVLKLAKRLRKDLEREGFEVYLTRDSDKFITLEERTAIANRLHADVFLSIHANASPNAKTHGVETYLLDTRYDRQTARVAARENGTTVGQLSVLQKILASLRLGYNERFAARLAQSVQGSLIGSLEQHYRGTRNLGVKRGPFLVLFQANMPAILVEVGFVSNRAESKRLKTDAFIKSAARGITQGVVGYRKQHAQTSVAGR